jgi:hypothetical protein
MNTVFIHTNKKQLLGAKLGKYSFEKEGGQNRNFEVKFLIAEELPEMQDFVGKTYITGTGLRTYSFENLQSFTLTRYKAPEAMNYEGKAIVTDPDIFALPGGNLGELFNFDLQGHHLAAYRRPNGEWETSLMVMDCAKLRHWKLSEMLKKLAAKEITHMDLNALKAGETMLALPEIWNSLDKIFDGAKILHTTKRLTQPWRTGLKIDFTQKAMPKILGIIPREPFYKLMGKYPTHYQPHPNKQVVDFFFNLAKNALKDGAITEAEIKQAILEKDVRPDFFEVLKKY